MEGKRSWKLGVSCKQCTTSSRDVAMWFLVRKGPLAAIVHPLGSNKCLYGLKHRALASTSTTSSRSTWGRTQTNIPLDVCLATYSGLECLTFGILGPWDAWIWHQLHPHGPFLFSSLSSHLYKHLNSLTLNYFPSPRHHLVIHYPFTFLVSTTSTANRTRLRLLSLFVQVIPFSLALPILNRIAALIYWIT